MTKDDDGLDQRQQMLRASGQFTGHGLTLALAVLFFMWLGYQVDRKVGSGPIFTILGAFVGGGAGFYSLYYHIVIQPRSRGDDPQ